MNLPWTLSAIYQEMPCPDAFWRASENLYDGYAGSLLTWWTLRYAYLEETTIKTKIISYLTMLKTAINVIVRVVVIFITAVVVENHIQLQFNLMLVMVLGVRTLAG